MMLIDKGYYDYDFKAPKIAQAQLLYENTVKSEAETRSLLSKFGIGRNRELDMEELQEYAINDMTNSKQ